MARNALANNWNPTMTTKLLQRSQHFKKWHVLGNGTHLCSPGMFLCRTLCRNNAIKLSFQLSYLVVHRNWYKSTYQAHIDFFHTQNHIRSKSLTHRWKGEIKGAICTPFQPKKVALRPTFKVLQHKGKEKCSTSVRFWNDLC